MCQLKRLCNGKFPQRFLQNLKMLKVEFCAELEEVFEIDEFYYSGGQNQPYLLKGSLPYFCLQSLEVVEIDGCKKLKSLFSPFLIQSLLRLEELRIRRCNELKTVFTESRSHDPHPLCLPRLRTLCICDCERLEYVLPITLAQAGLPQLERLEIEFCGGFKTVVAELENDGGETESSSHDPHPLCWPRLTTLRIYHCARLEYVLPITLAQGLPRLETMALFGRAKLKQVFGVSKQQDGVEHCIELPCLTGLELHNLKNLSNFGPQNYIVKLPALKKLVVSGCPQLIKCTNQEVDNHFVHLQKTLTPDVEGLTSLRLGVCEDLECLVDTTIENVPICVVFANLVELVLQNMIGLTMLCNSDSVSLPKVSYKI